MAEPLILLDKKKINKALTTKKSKIDILESICSTNEYFKTNNNDINVCIAENMTGGRGRLQRSWSAPFGKNIYLSLLHKFNQDISALAGFSLVLSLAVVATVQQFMPNEKIQIKWPNDVLWNNKKLAGILIDVSAESNGTCEATIGIGINVNMLDSDVRVNQPWVSLRKITNKYIDRNIVTASLIDNLINCISKFETVGLKGFQGQWRQYDNLFGKNIKISVGNKIITGVAVGINEQGHLKLKLANGEIQRFSAGDASIVKSKNAQII